MHIRDHVCVHDDVIGTYTWRTGNGGYKKLFGFDSRSPNTIRQRAMLQRCTKAGSWQ